VFKMMPSSKVCKYWHNPEAAAPPLAAVTVTTTNEVLVTTAVAVAISVLVIAALWPALLGATPFAGDAPFFGWTAGVDAPGHGFAAALGATLCMEALGGDAPFRGIRLGDAPYGRATRVNVLEERLVAMFWTNPVALAMVEFDIVVPEDSCGRTGVLEAIAVTIPLVLVVTCPRTEAVNARARMKQDILKRVTVMNECVQYEKSRTVMSVELLKDLTKEIPRTY
jgi:hypothetical protein